MAITVIPTASGGGIKSVQRGLAGAAGTVTITSVDISKSFVTVYGTTSTGAVGGSASVSAQNGSTSGSSGNFGSFTIQQLITNNTGSLAQDAGTGTARTQNTNGQNYNANGKNVSLNAQALSGGTNNLVSAVTQGYLSNSTSLVVSGACRWEVVEFA